MEKYCRYLIRTAIGTGYPSDILVIY